MFTRDEDMMVKQELSLNDFSGLRVHLLGIGGSGMSGAAGLLLKLGAHVSGSDAVAFEGMNGLVARGARIVIGHRNDPVDTDVDLLVASAAIPETNPELAQARARDIPIVKYAELLGVLMAGFERGIAIAGTHGKSTTTALCAHLCRESGLAPSFLIGARSEQLGGGSDIGEGTHFIVESCEFDRSFLNLAPHAAAILNIEPDHLDCYRDLEEIIEAFAEFSRRVDSNGLLVCNADDANVERAVRSTTACLQTFGFHEDADWRALNVRGANGCYSFVVQFRGSPVLSTRLSILGRHNVYNALAAVALAYHAGADFDALAAALPTFSGVARRLSFRGEGNGVTIVDDYAHHPTEIRVTIEAARECYHPKRVWVVFQPHQHSRTQMLMDEFAQSFGDADEIIVPDVFDARSATDRATRDGSRELADRLCRAGGRARYLPDLAAVANHVVEHIVSGDLVLTLGAGDVWKVANELVARVCEPNPV